jgi:hypothetical protein
MNAADDFRREYGPAELLLPRTGFFQQNARRVAQPFVFSIELEAASSLRTGFVVDRSPAVLKEVTISMS